MGKVAVVTGASGGIGRAVAERLLKENYVVFSQYKSHKENCVAGTAPVFGDFSTQEGVKEFADKILSNTKKIDVLVNNAGVSLQKLFTDCSESDVENTIFCDLTAVMLLTKYLAPTMVSFKSGSIVNISSVWGVYGGSCEVAYSAAKGGIIAFTKALAKELGPSGIRVNCISPGLIDTAMNNNLSADDKAAFAESTALGRMGKTEEIASCVSFLAGEESSFVTGQVLSADGGF